MIKFAKKGVIVLKWFLFIVQIILAIFAYKQMNQNHLDTWFTVFIVFFFIFVFWYDDRYQKN